MRAREFVINVPITIKINGDGDPELEMSGSNQDDAVPENELEDNPVMVSPLQQQLELQKAQVGKNSPVIDDLTQDKKEAEPSVKSLSLFRR